MPDYTIDSVQTCFNLLRLISSSNEPCALLDLAAGAGISRSTAYRMLWNLELAGLVRRPEDGGYALGTAALDLGSAYGRQNALLKIAPAFVEELRDDTQETCALLVRDGSERVCLFRANGTQEVHFNMRVGTMGPLWRGAAGRVLTAFLARNERHAILAGQPEAAAVEKDATKIAAAGYALALRDTAPDVWSVAFPVRQHACVVAALACAGPIQRNTPAHIDRCIKLTRAQATKLSDQLG